MGVRKVRLLQFFWYLPRAAQAALVLSAFLTIEFAAPAEALSSHARQRHAATKTKIM
jgi:hypothetical protein